MSDVTFDLDDDVAVITISAPPLNLCTWDLVDRLGDAVDLASGSAARAVLLRAEGKHFSAGADVKAMFKNVPVRTMEARLAKVLAILQRLQDLPVPTIAVAQGMCFTAGLEIALRCDLLWAGSGTKFAQLEAKLGTTTLFGGAQLLAERAGSGRALQICYSADIFDASIFEKWGVVNAVVPDDELQDSALRFAKMLASGPTIALAASKRLVRAGTENGVAAADRLLGAIGAPLVITRDMQGGVEALIEHGARHFVGKHRFEGA